MRMPIMIVPTGAIATLARDSGVQLMASVDRTRELNAGGDDPTNPHHGDAPLYPAVASVETVGNGGIVLVRALAVAMHYTAGYTAGSGSFAWRSCEGPRCLAQVYGGSITALGALAIYLVSTRTLQRLFGTRSGR